MQQVHIYNLSRPQDSAVVAKYCVSFTCRLRGLMFRRSLAAEEGLLLVQSRENRLDAAIHMLFMWVDLAVVWINAASEVVDVRLARRWRPIYVPTRPALYVLELAEGHLADFKVGDQVKFENHSLE
jgi:uncharacterized membrane protein (UPF0127 family)